MARKLEKVWREINTLQREGDSGSSRIKEGKKG
jgi:hypothetical protein